MQQHLIPLLYDALASDFGIRVTTNSPENLRQKLYPLRKDNPDFLCLGFKVSPLNPANELWIIKQPKELHNA